MRKTMFVGAWVGLLAGSLLAEPGVVVTRDGQTYHGNVAEKGGTVAVETRGVTAMLDRQNVVSITYVDDLQIEFGKRLDALEQDDFQGHLDLARWALERRAFVQARQAAEEARLLNPNSIEAVTLLGTIQAQMRLDLRQKQAEPEGQDAGAEDVQPQAPPASNPTTEVSDSATYLTVDQINTIRQAELSSFDTRARFNLVDDVRRRYAERLDIPIRDFLSQTQLDQAREILVNGTPEMKEDVRVMSDPATLVEYRRSIQPMVLASCATMGCHGGTSSAFRLHRGTASEALSYTNFYILQTYMVERETDQVFGGGDVRMLDRLRPAQSLLLQYGLPPNMVEEPHPPVRNFRPLFRSRDDTNYLRTLNWIASLNLPNPGDYGISESLSPNDANESNQPTDSPDQQPIGLPADDAATAPAVQQPTTSAAEPASPDMTSK